jgi:diacylglycerol kinase (ATP)
VRSFLSTHYGGTTVAETCEPGDEARLVREALAGGARTIVAVGGDGTASNVADALVKEGATTRLALVPAGTGCDLAKTLGLPPDDFESCLRTAHEGRSQRLDVGRIEDRHFVNIVGFGLDIAVLEDSWSVKYVRGALLYLYCALRQVFAYRGFGVEMAIDGIAAEHEELLMLIVANARVFGGGFKIAPAADASDGLLDMVGFRNAGSLRRLGIMRLLMAGRHMDQPEVISRRAARLALRFAAPPAYETDGEWRRAQSADLTIEVLPGALEVLVPQDAQAGS